MKHNDSLNANNSLSDPNYQQNLSEKMISIQSAFRKIDKNKDDFITQQELSEFLDSNMPVLII
jgi:Ca2+-binding EF-hand superfamily protein